MPFSFVQIERDKTQSIQWSLAFLIAFYLAAFLGIVFAAKLLIFHLYLADSSCAYDGCGFRFFDWPTAGWSTLGAGVASLIHWNYSTDGLVDKVLGFMNARLADTSRDDEKVFRNVVEEAAVATGSKFHIEPYIIPTTALNAFAIQDFEGRSVIGITEGLLKRLTRQQLEAVVAHEAGHIASGDSLSTCVTAAMFKVFDNVCDLSRFLMNGSSGGRGRRDGRLFIVLLVIFLLASLLRFLGYLGSMFISREREYRADAISVKLTRNPLALAEALTIIDGKWKGGGTPADSMDAIFIESPRKNQLEDNEDWFANLFTTHPPIKRRIAILLDMAHADTTVLDSVQSRSQTRFDSVQNSAQQSDSLKNLSSVTELSILSSMEAANNCKKDHCPRCGCSLRDESYERVSVMACPTCKGILIKELDVLSIVGKRERKFSSAIAELGDTLLKQPRPLARTPFDSVYDEKSIFCPHCFESSPRMNRRFINQRYPIEIDKCRICRRVWFDNDELELLQYVYEKEHA